MQRGQQETQGPAKAVTMVGAIGGTACSNMHNKQQPPSPEMMKAIRLRVTSYSTE